MWIDSGTATVSRPSTQTLSTYSPGYDQFSVIPRTPFATDGSRCNGRAEDWLRTPTARRASCQPRHVYGQCAAGCQLLRGAPNQNRSVIPAGIGHGNGFARRFDSGVQACQRMARRHLDR